MKIQEIYNLALQMGKESDFRGAESIEKMLKRRRELFDKLPEEKKKDFDRDDLINPFPDSRVLNVSEDKEIKKIMFGIDIAPAELLMAKEIEGIDLVISHHPLGKGLAKLWSVMQLQCDVLAYYGVPINIAEGLMTERISEVARGINAINHQRTVMAAELLGFNLMCLHTICDNLAARFLRENIESAKPERVGDIIDLLKKLPEYQKAVSIGAGPKIFVGSRENRCGKIALTEITGGTEGSSKIYQKIAQAGIGTVIGMHMSKEHYEEAKTAFINVVIAGHMSSDSLGINIFLDELEKRGIEIVPCSGLTRVSRVK